MGAAESSSSAESEKTLYAPHPDPPPPCGGGSQGEIDGDEVCALCFAIFSRAGYDTGDSQSGEPPDWCQYVVTPEGFWAANCFNFIGHGCRRCDCLNDGKLRYSNNPDLSVIPAPDAVIRDYR